MTVTEYEYVKVYAILQYSEEVPQSCSAKKAFLNISQNSQVFSYKFSSKFLRTPFLSQNSQVFSYKFSSKFLRTPFLQNTFGGYFWLSNFFQKVSRAQDGRKHFIVGRTEKQFGNFGRQCRLTMKKCQINHFKINYCSKEVSLFVWGCQANGPPFPIVQFKCYVIFL